MAKQKTIKTGQKQFWLFKSEPNAYSIDDLASEKKKTTCWDGVRNYQARNMLRDDIQVGDGVLFYHSRVEPMSIVGSCEVVKAGYPDHTAFDSKAKHFDAKSNSDDPTWYMVDVKLTQIFPNLLTRDQLRKCADLSEMMLLKRGCRLSIQKVTKAEWKAVHKLAGIKEK